MEIRTYDDVDPVEVLALNLVSLGFSLTPERAAQIRELDRRPFPFLAVYAVEDGIVVSQVGVFRLPVMTTEGPGDVGGVWAVSTQPAYRRRGISTLLMEEAHARMRAAGLRFSTLGTNRAFVAHRLYTKVGYVDAHIASISLARTQDVQVKSALKAKKTGSQGLAVADKLYQQLAEGQLGFSRRQPDFIQMFSATGELDGQLYLLENDGELVGYAVARVNDQVLNILNLLLKPGLEPSAAVSAVTDEIETPFVRVRIEHPVVAESLVKAGYPPPLPAYSTFMIKALYPEDNTEEACRLLGVGRDQFMISYMDTT